MPVSEPKRDHEALNDSSSADRDKDRDKEKGAKSKGPSKTKDLSHVPCKFFKVGSCTAGSSCPFSHSVLEPGQQKEVCAWFVKGNCKFGHKCALAHILPGQSMSMDRKNKKAAQLAANAGGGGREGGRGGRSQKGGGHSGGGGSNNPQARNSLLSGSTAPTRSLSNASRSAIPIPLKATLSPSAPAPPVKDTEFSSFGLPDETNKLSSAPAQSKSVATGASPGASVDAHDTAQGEVHKTDGPFKADGAAASPLPMSTPTSRRGNHASPAAIDFGPIGSPPRSSPSTGRPARMNGFSPGTSPQGPGLSTSPFSAPGPQTVFVVHDHDESSNAFNARSGLSASLGAMMTWTSDRNSAQARRDDKSTGEVVVEDEDLEEFLPSSLTDLLTPEERSRRYSRTNGPRPGVAGVDRDAAAGQRPSVEAHHRYSRSVPAPSLLQDIRSIWADQDGVGSHDVAGSPGTGAMNGAGGGLGNGTPSSFQSNSGLAGRASAEDMISPSNASAAFLPGLHQHYLNAKASRNLISGISLYPSTTSGNSVSHNMYSGSYGTGLDGNALSPPRTSAFGGRASNDIPSDMYNTHASHRPSGRPIPVGYDGFAPDSDDRPNALSPSARALQAHAPGQSLPQGLAAGYSRIHALPPPAAIGSPSTPGVFSIGQVGGFSPGTKVLGHSQSTSGEWHSLSQNAGNLMDHSMAHGVQMHGVAPNSTSLGGLEAVFSRLSYSAATSRPSVPAGIGSRIPSGRGYNGQGSLSPLSGPVLTVDDDDLFFSMDG